jgi:hypothetical protein
LFADILKAPPSGLLAAVRPQQGLAAFFLRQLVILAVFSTFVNIFFYMSKIALTLVNQAY